MIASASRCGRRDSGAGSRSARPQLGAHVGKFHSDVGTTVGDGGTPISAAGRARWHLCRTMTDHFLELDHRCNDRIDVRLLCGTNATIA